MRLLYILSGGLALGILPLVKLWMIFPISLDSKLIRAQLVSVVVLNERLVTVDAGVHVVGVVCNEVEVVVRVPLNNEVGLLDTSHRLDICGSGRYDEVEKISRFLNSSVSGFWSPSRGKFILTQFDGQRSSNLIWLAVILFVGGSVLGARLGRSN